jgi:predicted MFS family arabinose efflux permease/phenylpyruvate tautomerase PptA (4-oxalocrotonate tautomerase family)
MSAMPALGGPEVGNGTVTDVGTRAEHAHSPLWRALALAVGPLVALGLARFAYALLLPAMRADLGWSYAQAGALNTANAAGYLLGALVTAAVAERCGARRTFVGGILGTAFAMMASAGTSSFEILLGLRFVAGFLGALAFIVGAALAAEAGAGAGRGRQSLLIAVYFGGGGLGIALSSLIGPLALSVGPTGWRWGWLGFGVAALLAGLIARRAIGGERKTGAAAADDRSGAAGVSLLPLTVAYTLFGAGYIAYMTFIVAFLRGEGYGDTSISAFWTLLGVAAAAAGFGWGAVLARFRGGWPMGLVLLINAAGAVAPLITANVFGAFLSAVLFGASVMAAPSAATAFIRKARSPQAWTAAIARLTAMFALGQCVGPLLAGHLSDSPSGIRLGLLSSVAILALGILAAALQRDPASARHPTGTRPRRAVSKPAPKSNSTHRENRMPLATISLRRGKPLAYRRAISENVHRALVEIVGIPDEDRFHLINEYDADGLLYHPSYLGIARSDDIVIIQITLRIGRSRETRVALHRRIAALLAENPGVRPQDVFITLVENDYADWSVGNGEAPLMKLIEA